MKAEKKLNAVRSGIVVIGALAFGYLTLQIGFKPFLLKAQQHEEQQQQSLHSQETLINDQQQQQQQSQLLQMEGEENREDSDDENWWDAWGRRRRMAVAQVICYVAYAICVYHEHCNKECSESATSVESRKRKALECERQFEGIRKAINDVAEAIRDGNDVIEKTVDCVHSEEQVFAELVRVGVEQPLLCAAFNFLVNDGARVKTFLGQAADERKEFLLRMMYGPRDS